MNAAVVVVGDYLSLFNLSTVDPISVRCYAQYESSTLRCQKSANVLIVNTVERAERLALFLYFIRIFSCLCCTSALRVLLFCLLRTACNLPRTTYSTNELLCHNCWNDRWAYETGNCTILARVNTLSRAGHECRNDNVQSTRRPA